MRIILALLLLLSMPARADTAIADMPVMNLSCDDVFIGQESGETVWNKASACDISEFSSSIAAAGSDRSIQFNNASALGGSSSFVFTATGRLGIGTASPGTTIDVRGASTFNDDSGDNDFRVESDNLANILFIDAGNDRIGINTNAPSAALLHVTGGSSTAALFERSGATSNTTWLANRIAASRTSSMGTGFGTIQSFEIKDSDDVYNPIGYIGAVRDGSDNNGDLIFMPVSSGTPNEIVRINSNGAVAITGTLSTTGASTAATYNGVALTTGGTSTEYLSEDGTYSTPAGGSATAAGANGTIQFNNASSFAGASTFNYNSGTGQVSLGAVNPSSSLKLDVEGSVGATQYCNESGTDCFNAATIQNNRIRSFGFSIDGAGDPIESGVKGDIIIPYNMTITGWTILADVSGTMNIDVWKDTYANFPPTSLDSISGSEPITLGGVAKNQDNSLSSWSPAVTAGDIIRFNVPSTATTITRVNGVIYGTAN